MKDPLTELEEELRELTPQHPTRNFIEGVSDALGSQGNIAVINQPSEKTAQRIFFPLLKPLGIAAAILTCAGIMGTSIYIQKQNSSQLAKTKVNEIPVPPVPDSEQETPAAEPLLWHTTDRETILVDVRNEGVIHSPQNPPSQQFRYRYLDKTTFTDPTEQSSIQMAVPREQVIQVKLEPY
jgi:hypothetical protein